LTKFKGYLDRLRENVESLDEAIETAKANSKKRGRDALQWAKTLRDLIELRWRRNICSKLRHDHTIEPLRQSHRV